MSHGQGLHFSFFEMKKMVNDCCSSQDLILDARVGWSFPI